MRSVGTHAVNVLAPPLSVHEVSALEKKWKVSLAPGLRPSLQAGWPSKLGRVTDAASRLLAPERGYRTVCAMASSLPIVRQIAWLSLVPQLTVLLSLITAVTALGIGDPVLVGLLCYLVLVVAVRWLIPRHHRRGISLVKRQRFADAIPEFRQSYEFFANAEWVDRWRSITMLSSSRMTYREMALLNVAFCLTQTGERDQALAEYRRVIGEFPGSKMAETSIRMLELPVAGARESP